MPIAQSLLPEFDHEMATTRRLLERVPEDRASWTPHPKSTSLGGLAAHIATLAGMAVNVLGLTEVDVNPPGGTPRTPLRFTSTADLLATFDEKVQASRAAIAAATDEDLRVEWSLLNAGKPIFSLPRVAALRTMMMSHIIHHRGQLSVYLRLNDVPLPSIYGPTADAPL